jgi:polyketide biosynthesis 3-hydroxy-3-methylglutaryl-CoA synthase-like enzyme PksG
MEEYDALLMGSGAVRFGTRNVKLDFELIPNVLAACQGKERLFLEEIREFHREYRWGV